MKEREEGNMIYFSRQEPEKLFNDDVLTFWVISFFVVHRNSWQQVKLCDIYIYHSSFSPTSLE